MFGRIFGRGKEEPTQSVCAECGRTLLAGEWTQTVMRGDEEVVVCSLCCQAHPFAPAQRPASEAMPADDRRAREPQPEPRDDQRGETRGEPRDDHSDSDAFWRAFKEKDAQIEHLEARLARLEAEKQELIGRLAQMEAAPPAAAPAVAASPAPEQAPVAASFAPVQIDEEPEAASETWGETPADAAAAIAEFRAMDAAARAAMDAGPRPDHEPAREEAAPEQAPAEVPPIAFEDTQPIPTVDVEPAGQPAEEAPVDRVAPIAAGGQLPGEPGAPLDEPVGGAAAEPAAPEADLEAAASLTLLQRGVDLLNVSNVPRKIAETNEQLGMPSVHVGFDGQIVAVTFLWSMGWYCFHVDIDASAVTLDERGYDDRPDLQPNAGVRADGTVQLAPAQISRAAAQRAARQEPERPATAEHPASAGPEPEPEPEPEVNGPETPRVAAQKPPEILSKSLLGQRSDDEPASWESTQARDFNWDR